MRDGESATIAGEMRLVGVAGVGRDASPRLARPGRVQRAPQAQHSRQSLGSVAHRVGDSAVELTFAHVQVACHLTDAGRGAQAGDRGQDERVRRPAPTRARRERVHERSLGVGAGVQGRRQSAAAISPHLMQRRTRIAKRWPVDTEQRRRRTRAQAHAHRPPACRQRHEKRGGIGADDHGPSALYPDDIHTAVGYHADRQIERAALLPCALHPRKQRRWWGVFCVAHVASLPSPTVAPRHLAYAGRLRGLDRRGRLGDTPGHDRP